MKLTSDEHQIVLNEKGVSLFGSFVSFLFDFFSDKWRVCIYLRKEKNKLKGGIKVSMEETKIEMMMMEIRGVDDQIVEWTREKNIEDNGGLLGE